jgi:hypothetical protein
MVDLLPLVVPDMVYLFASPERNASLSVGSVRAPVSRKLEASAARGFPSHDLRPSVLYTGKPGSNSPGEVLDE